MNSDFADAGDLALDADNLAVRLVRVDAPFADEFAARRESANLERALVERVQLFQETAFYTKGEVVASTATAPRHTLVRPVASDLLAVVTDERHAQIVGLFLKAEKPNAWSVFDTGGSSQAARDVLRAVLPKDGRTAVRQWRRFGRKKRRRRRRRRRRRGGVQRPNNIALCDLAARG